jgi:hypothetical protein
LNLRYWEADQSLAGVGVDMFGQEEVSERIGVEDRWDLGGDGRDVDRDEGARRNGRWEVVARFLRRTEFSAAV